jgi:hypothetical protein
LNLVELGLLEKHREGEAVVFQMPKKLRDKLAGKSAAQ